MTSALIFYISRLISTKEELLIILLACLISQFSCSCLMVLSLPSARAEDALNKPGPKLTEPKMVTLGEICELWICSFLSTENKIIADFLSYLSAFRGSPCTSKQDLASCVEQAVTCQSRVSRVCSDNHKSGFLWFPWLPSSL